MPHSLYRNIWIATAAILVVGNLSDVSVLAQGVPSNQLVRIHLSDGRIAVGTLVASLQSANSDTAPKWIEIASTAPGVLLKSRFPLSQIREIEPFDTPPPLHGDWFPKQDLQQQNGSATPLPEIRVQPPMVLENVESEPVSSMSLIATAANWDRDAALDGLVVSIALSSNSGQPLSRNGTIRFELIGERFNTNLDEKRFQSLGRWSVKVAQKDFFAGEVIIKLPWKQVDPSRRGEFRPEGLLTARMNIAGEGSFDASDSAVPLREVSVIRDDSQLRRENRYFPQENIPERQ